jgi:hypothetical protein
MRLVNKTGYLKGAKTAKNPVNIIPSNLITTQGMAFPIKANGKTLYPNTGQYKFPTSPVVETPLKQKGTKSAKAQPKPSWFNTPIEFGKEPGSIGRYIGKALTLGAEPPKGRGYSITPSETAKQTAIDYATGEIGGAVLNRAMPYVKKAMPYVKGLFSGAGESFIGEAAGKLFRGKANKKAIDKGNEWLQNWIKHPKTQAKIDVDMDAAIQNRLIGPGQGNSVVADIKNAATTRDVNALRKQSKTFTPSSKEYSLKKQLKDLKHSSNIHKDNRGVSYRHSDTVRDRNFLDNNPVYKDDMYSNSWISRKPNMSQVQRESTTIHEGLHDWVTDEALKTSGQRNSLLNAQSPEARKKFLKWESLRNQGQSPSSVMGNVDAYEGYMANPTEMHARIMQLRKHFDLTPDMEITPDMAKGMMDKIKAMPHKKQPIDIESFSDVIGGDHNKLANLMNRLWIAPAVGAAGVAAQEKKNGAKLIKYKNGSKSVSLAFSRGEKDPKGGLTQKGVDKYNRATGGNLKMAVTTPPSKLKPGSKAANRRKSFCARMSGVKGPMEKNGKPTRKALALRKWNC